jgi:hypothetical protein
MSTSTTAHVSHLYATTGFTIVLYATTVKLVCTLTKFSSAQAIFTYNDTDFNGLYLKDITILTWIYKYVLISRFSVLFNTYSYNMHGSTASIFWHGLSYSFEFRTWKFLCQVWGTMDTLATLFTTAVHSRRTMTIRFMFFSCQNRRTVVVGFTYVALAVSIMSSFNNCYICVIWKRTGLDAICK